VRQFLLSDWSLHATLWMGREWTSLTCSKVLVCGHPCQCLWLELVTLNIRKDVRPVATKGHMWGHPCMWKCNDVKSSLPVHLLATIPYIDAVPLVKPVHCTYLQHLSVFITGTSLLGFTEVHRQWPPLHVTWNCMLWPRKGIRCIPIEKILSYGPWWLRWLTRHMRLLFHFCYEGVSTSFERPWTPFPQIWFVPSLNKIRLVVVEK
jgi:hypothetical protein